MNFISYLLRCVNEAITMGIASDLANGSNKMFWIGIGIILAVIGLFICNLLIFKNLKYKVIFAILSTIVILALFIGLSILIEFIIKK